jgi:hypothetical protein
MPDEPTPVISPDEPSAAQVAELDFEGQAARAAEEAVQAPAHDEAEERLARVEAELAYTQQALEAQNRPQAEERRGLTLEELEDLADENPLAAADYLAQARVGQLAQSLGQQLAPVLHSHNQAEATRTIGELQAEFGEAFEMHRERLVEVIARDEAFYTDPATRIPRLQQALRALEYERLAGDPDAQQPRNAETGRFESPRQTRSVYVEPGSGPQPNVQQPEVDPVIAEMNVFRGDAGEDAFGRKGPAQIYVGR